MIDSSAESETVEGQAAQSRLGESKDAKRTDLVEGEFRAGALEHVHFVRVARQQPVHLSVKQHKTSAKLFQDPNRGLRAKKSREQAKAWYRDGLRLADAVAPVLRCQSQPRHTSQKSQMATTK